MYSGCSVQHNKVKMVRPSARDAEKMALKQDYTYIVVLIKQNATKLVDRLTVVNCDGVKTR
jgi:hypothetical protein